MFYRTKCSLIYDTEVINIFVSVNVFVSPKCLHDKAEKFCVTGVPGEAVGAHGKVNAVGLQGAWGGYGWFTTCT